MSEKYLLLFIIALCMVILFVISIYNNHILTGQLSNYTSQNANTNKKLATVSTQLTALKNIDQIKRNNALETEIKNIEITYKSSIADYQNIIDLKLNEKTDPLDALYAQAVSQLAALNYASAQATLTDLQTKIQTDQDKIAAAQAPNVVADQSVAAPSNTPPSNGYSVQKVSTDVGDFTISIVAADLNSTRVIVDTASDSDCSNNCPVLPLDQYVARNGAFAGINGSFFCPADYPSCDGKTGSFDTLLMNKNKVYFNSANNVYSNVPLVYFTGNTMGVRTASSQWGRDTGVDSVIAMQPLLVLNGQVAFSGSDDPKINSKGTRDFIGNNGSTVYIGTIYDASSSDAAHVLKTLGLQNALNLDEGGSTALWYGGGYKAGPGRNIPNAVLFVHK